jgi:hypothetical protein
MAVTGRRKMVLREVWRGIVCSKRMNGVIAEKVVTIPSRLIVTTI